MSEAPPPCRRWFQFRLRGLLVAVTLLAVFMGWLGWELKFIRARKAALADGSVIGRLRPDELDFKELLPQATLATIPFWRRWFGDNAYQWLSVPAESTQADMDRMKEMFPEAIVVRGGR